MVAEKRALSFKRELNRGMLRNDRVELAVRGLQEDGGKLSKLLAATFALGQIRPAPAPGDDAKDRLAEILSCLVRICAETAILMETLAAAPIAAQLNARLDNPDPTSVAGKAAEV